MLYCSCEKSQEARMAGRTVNFLVAETSIYFVDANKNKCGARNGNMNSPVLPEDVSIGNYICIYCKGIVYDLEMGKGGEKCIGVKKVA